MVFGRREDIEDIIAERQAIESVLRRYGEGPRARDWAETEEDILLSGIPADLLRGPTRFPIETTPFGEERGPRGWRKLFIKDMLEAEAKGLTKEEVYNKWVRRRKASGVDVQSATRQLDRVLLKYSEVFE